VWWNKDYHYENNRLLLTYCRFDHSCIVHSRNVHPCHIVPICPLLHYTLPQIQRSLRNRGVYSMKHECSLRPWKTEGERKSCIFSWKLGREKFRGRKTKLLKHIFALSSYYFLKKFLDRSIRPTFYFYPPIRGRGTYTAGAVKSVCLSKVGRKSVDFPSGTIDDLMSPNWSYTI